MNWFHYLIVWKGRECVGIKEFGTDSKACNLAVDSINEPLERGIVPEITAQMVSCFPEGTHDYYVGYTRDDQFRDDLDWCSDFADTSRSD